LAKQCKSNFDAYTWHVLGVRKWLMLLLCGVIGTYVSE